MMDRDLDYFRPRKPITRDFVMVSPPETGMRIETAVKAAILVMLSTVLVFLIIDLAAAVPREIVIDIYTDCPLTEEYDI